MLPYAEITDSADRRWTMRLLERLCAFDLPEDECAQLGRALRSVSDPRSFNQLEAIVVDHHRADLVRETASAALRRFDYVALDVSEEKLSCWWREGDSVLQRHALRSMSGNRCPDVVAAVAADRTHPLQTDALAQMDFWFDNPEHQAIKIAGLSHPDPKTRATAAYVLYYDEPVAAESPLIEATRDSEADVAVEAANNLGYYPTQRAIHRLFEMLEHPVENVRARARESFESIREQLLNRLCGRDRLVAEHIRKWLQPVWGILSFIEEELRPYQDEPTSAKPEDVKHTLPISDILALLTDPDVSPKILDNQLWSNNWRGYSADERRLLRPVLLSHPDQVVRDKAAWIFNEWDDSDALLLLLGDADFCVRKTAMYWLGQMPPLPGVADMAWEHLHRLDTVGVHATETLRTFVRHAEPETAIRRLSVIAADHGWRESLRHAALCALCGLGAAEEIGHLTGLLYEPPIVTWVLHTCLLEAIVDLRLPRPEIRHLLTVDHLQVQEAVAKFVSG